MYYVVSISYVGPDPEQHLNESRIVIQGRPERGNSDNRPEIIAGWCGTTNDWMRYAHGSFESIEAAREKVADVAAHFGYREDEADNPDDAEFGVFESYKFGVRPYATAEASCGWASPLLDELTSDTTDTEIEVMVDDVVREARQETGNEPNSGAIYTMLVDFRDDLAEMASEE